MDGNDHSIFLRQVLALTRANLKSRYRKTFAGFLWVVLNPVVMFGVQSLIFQHILQIPVTNYFVFLLSGLLPWIFIVQSMDMCTSIFVTNSQVLKSFQFRPLVLLFAQLLDNFINFVAAFVIVFTALALHQGVAWKGLLFAPLALAVLAIGTTALCWLLATMQVFLRDTRFVVQFGTSIMFFLTPIFYPREMVPAGFRWMADFNPLYRLIEPFRIAVYDFRWENFQRSLVQGAIVATVLLASSAFVWRSRRSAMYVQL